MKINIIDASKRIAENTILSNVSLEMESGHIYGIVGANGSGKTMLLRLICGLIKASEGSVWINHEKLGKEIDFPKSVGILIEGPAFIDYYSGLKNLMLLAELNNQASMAEIADIMTRLGLDPEDKKKYGKYSLGMKQKLGIAAAMMEQPELLILDEPTNALDEQSSQIVKDLLLERKQKGTLIVIASHDKEFINGLADQVFKVADGEVEVLHG